MALLHQTRTWTQTKVLMLWCYLLLGLYSIYTFCNATLPIATGLRLPEDTNDSDTGDDSDVGSDSDIGGNRVMSHERSKRHALMNMQMNSFPTNPRHRGDSPGDKEHWWWQWQWLLPLSQQVVLSSLLDCSQPTSSCKCTLIMVHVTLCHMYETQYMTIASCRENQTFPLCGLCWDSWVWMCLV